jgi:hypothetical protein
MKQMEDEKERLNDKVQKAAAQASGRQACWLNRCQCLCDAMLGGARSSIHGLGLAITYKAVLEAVNDDMCRSCCDAHAAALPDASSYREVCVALRQEHDREVAISQQLMVRRSCCRRAAGNPVEQCWICGKVAYYDVQVKNSR